MFEKKYGQKESPKHFYFFEAETNKRSKGHALLPIDAKEVSVQAKSHNTCEIFRR